MVRLPSAASASCAILLVHWPATPATPTRTTVTILLITAQWTYITGEVLSNTITIGEPPGDIGGLLEIVSGGMSGAGLLGLTYLTISKSRRRSTTAITTLAAATAWWFTHPIDQSTPPCVPGNPLYNLTHGTDC